MFSLCARVLSIFWIVDFLTIVDAFVVAQTDPAATAVENPPPEDPPSLKFTWTIPMFTRLNTRKHYSDVFVVGGYKW